MNDQNNDDSLTVTSKVHFGRGAHGRVELRPGAAPEQEAPQPPAGRVPRVARVMALAIHFDGLLRRGEVKDLAELAAIGRVSRARVSQIMNLLMLAPDLQEELLFLPPTARGPDGVKEWQVGAVAAEPAWARQRKAWGHLGAPAPR